MYTLSVIVILKPSLKVSLTKRKALLLYVWKFIDNNDACHKMFCHSMFSLANTYLCGSICLYSPMEQHWMNMITTTPSSMIPNCPIVTLHIMWTMSSIVVQLYTAQPGGDMRGEHTYRTLQTLTWRHSQLVVVLMIKWMMTVMIYLGVRVMHYFLICPLSVYCT